MTNRRVYWGRVLAAACGLAACTTVVSGAVILSDGFGDGDRDNNGLDSGAVVQDAADVGVPWYGVLGTTSFIRTVVDDSAGIGAGNALRMSNTASNNRTVLTSFPDVTLADGDKIVFRFTARLAALGPAGSFDRAFRFGLYNHGGTVVAGDLGSGDNATTDNDLGYNARVDVGPDASNATTMDVKRDDSAGAGSTIAGTATTFTGEPSSSNLDDRLLIDGVGHIFELTLERDGSAMNISIKKDGNPAALGVDATPPSFTFNEAAITTRSNIMQDLMLDNMYVEYIPIPEPTSLGAAGVAAIAVTARRSRRVAK